MPTTHRLNASLVIMVGAILAVVTFAVPATAATAPTTWVTSQNPKPGSDLTFCGSGFPAGEGIDIGIDGGLDIEDEFVPFATADASGSFCLTLPLADWISGTHTLTATGTISRATSSTTFHVAQVSANPGTTKDGTTSGRQLASTGGAVTGVGALGGLLLLCGTAMVVASGRSKVRRDLLCSGLTPPG